MAELSNFFASSTPPPTGSNAAVATSPSIVCRSPTAGEWEKALSLLLGKPNQPASSQHVAQFIQFAEQRQMDIRSLIVAEAGGEIVYAALPLQSPGHTTLLLVPAALPPAAVRPAATAVLDAVCRAASLSGALLAQTLLDVADHDLRDFLQECQFRFIAELQYLHVDVRRAQQPVIVPPGMGWETYRPSAHARFARTICASYRESLDCPALNGLRDIEDVIEGHKATGQFDPGEWFLLSDGSDSAAAVLLLNKMPHTHATELVYLGLAPEARGRGLADVMMRQALSRTAGMGSTQLSLAVDSTNIPALKLYFRHGLQRFGGKLAMMRDLRPDKSAKTKQAPAP